MNIARRKEQHTTFGLVQKTYKSRIGKIGFIHSYEKYGLLQRRLFAQKRVFISCAGYISLAQG